MFVSVSRNWCLRICWLWHRFCEEERLWSAIHSQEHWTTQAAKGFRKGKRKKSLCEATNSSRCGGVWCDQFLSFSISYQRPDTAVSFWRTELELQICSLHNSKKHRAGQNIPKLSTDWIQQFQKRLGWSQQQHWGPVHTGRLAPIWMQTLSCCLQPVWTLPFTAVCFIICVRVLQGAARPVWTGP